MEKLMWRNGENHYGRITIGLHWLVAAPTLHKGTGVLLFMVMIARVVWRHSNPRPAVVSTVFNRLFDTLDELEARLSKQRYLVGDQITEADWRLFTTLVRFDSVYYNHVKTNKKRLMDYPNLWSYTRELYQIPGVAETVNMDHIKYHYFASHHTINPTGIVPKGPDINFLHPHDRDSIS